MATQLQSRRGTTAQMNAFTGAEGEIAVNTSTDTLHVHDGSTAGGHALAKADGSNIATYAGSFTTIAASGATTLSSTLAVTGALTVDTNTLVVDATNNRVGVGTSSPSNSMTISNGSSGVTEANGAIVPLVVENSSSAYINFLTPNNANAGFLFSDPEGNNVGQMQYLHGSDALVFATSASERMRISGSNVGIGTSSPTRKLDVNGSGIVRGFLTTYGAGVNNALFLNNTAYEWAAYTNSSNNFEIADWNLSQTRLTIDTSGNVGIGVSAPTYKIDATTTSGGNGLKMARGTNSFFEQFQNTSGGVQLAASGSGAFMAFRTGTTAGTTTERMRISGSNLLVGTTSAAQDSGSGVKLKLDSGQARCFLVADATTGEGFSMRAGGAYKFFVGYNGTINATNTTISGISDVRYKENIRDLDDGLAKVMQLQPRKFDWKEGKGKDIANDRGFIAHEFETVFPDLISEWKDPAPEGEEPYKAVRADLIPTLVKAIQEQQATIEALTQRIETLENN